MCDWPVYGPGHYADSYRRCDFAGIHRIGTMDVCGRHLTMLVDGVLDAMRREGRQLIKDGRVTPGGIEAEARFVLASIERERRTAKCAREGTQPCVYFAEREGYVKIGSTTNLAKRMYALAAGGNLLDGMTAGPLKLLATVPGGPAEEAAFHRRFLLLRADPRREWFQYRGGLREFVEGLQATA